MAYTHYDRLTALDSSFLELESDGVHMHVGSVGVFESGPLATQEGGLDFERVLALSDTALARIPRFRQKLARIPLVDRPVWVDDEHFNPLYHLRHTALPRPGSERQLKRLAGRIMSQKLDTAKPMWELWFVEGLEGNRFAVISKIHHCLIDGISGVDLLAAFMGTDADHRIGPAEYPWLPRPAPGALRMLADEAVRRVAAPSRALFGAARSLSDPGRAVENAAHTTAGFVEAMSHALVPASETPLNVPIGPHRRFDWTTFDLGVVREVRQRIGGTLNDVVLTCVAGAVRHYLSDHGTPLDEIDFRAFIPVSTRRPSQRGKLGNHVSMLVAELPVGVADPVRRAEHVVEVTRRIKASGQAEGSEVLEEISDVTAPGLLAGVSRLAASRRAFNLVVTNVPGPGVPVYLDGARMLESYPLVPLFENQALGIALFSYDGRLFWGFNSDRDAMPDVHAFAQAIDHEFEALRKL
ncbi:MAG: WS/DGAT/MGAT family O-acyltransferase [Myxococcota bacterium]